MSTLDDLLDATLDDLEDLPEIKPFTAGAHRCTLSFSSKEVNSKPAVEAEFTYLETVELADPQAVAPKAGDKASSLFFLDNEYGRGKFKKLAAKFSALAGSSNLRTIVETVKDVEIILINSIKVDKSDSTKEYLEIKEVEIL